MQDEGRDEEGGEEEECIEEEEETKEGVRLFFSMVFPVVFAEEGALSCGS